MGLIERALGGAEAVGSLGDAAEGLSEVFVPNATRAMELAADIHQATLETAVAEFQYAGTGWFDRMINGLNRLPRPMLALGTLGLFVYAMADPPGFADRMIGLQEVPEPLWWLLGAIVSFYFGAREMHYSRGLGAARQGRRQGGREEGRGHNLRAQLGSIFGRRRPAAEPGQDPAEQAAADNPALSEWRADG